MSELTINGAVSTPDPRPRLDQKPHMAGAFAFLLVLAAGLAYAGFSIVSDVHTVGEHDFATGALVLLGIALLIALGFEFVNGFHDTANAVATVIYTHSLPPLARACAALTGSPSSLPISRLDLAPSSRSF